MVTMVIHTIGDSHSYNGWQDVPDVQIHHVGAKLCYSVGRDGINIKGYNIQSGDVIIFSFGEIDCRCHVHKHITESTDYRQIIDDIVDTYCTQIKHAVDTFENIKTVIYNVVPPIQKHNTWENPEFPYVGTDEERKTYALYFNETLQKKCVEYNFLFFDIYDKYVDSNGYLHKALSDGNVHIRDGIYIKQFVENNLL